MGNKGSSESSLKSEEALDFIRGLNCSVCLIVGVDPHHVKTRGAGGKDTLDNLMPLCREHHTEIHKIGKKTFFKKYEEKILSHRILWRLPPLKGME